jgi:hypothetical protein
MLAAVRRVEEDHGPPLLLAAGPYSKSGGAQIIQNLTTFLEFHARPMFRHQRSSSIAFLPPPIPPLHSRHSRIHKTSRASIHTPPHPRPYSSRHARACPVFAETTPKRQPSVASSSNVSSPSPVHTHPTTCLRRAPNALNSKLVCCARGFFRPVPPSGVCDATANNVPLCSCARAAAQ